MTEGKVTVGLIQTSISEDIGFNLKKTAENVKEAIARGAKIICLQELYKTRYFPQSESVDVSHLSETVPGESTVVFSKLARENEVVIIVPIFEKGEDGSYFNTAVVIDADGRSLDSYHKIHIPYDPMFYEKNYFKPGEEYRVYDTRYARFAVLICYDQWFPEAARIVTLKGADIIFYPTAVGWIAGKVPVEGNWHDAWETVQRAHAITNGVYVAAVNRVGREDNLIFWGGSFICDSFGKVIARASDKDDEVLIAELDLTLNDQVREGWGFLRNRCPKTYGILTEPVEACIRQTPSICLGDTPARLGYCMPAEWERHDAIWLSWPYDLDSFPEVDEVEKAYISIIKAIHESEFVNLLVKDELMQARVADLLKQAGVNLRRLKFHLVNYADVWFRDYGPTFVVNRSAKKLAMVNWIFNAWGGKYPELVGDSRIPYIINDDLKLECFRPGIVLEGGSIEVNGCGTVITTEQCLLNRNRNPTLTKEQIEAYLREYLGACNIIWLKQGIAGDDTDGHVDDIARFVDPTTVLCAYEDDENDDNYQPLKDSYEILSSAVDQNGNTLKVIKLPMPGFVGGERRLPASYANFYIGNDIVLVPVFGHKNDQVALKIIEKAFPNRKVLGVDCKEMVHGLGTIHCISQQQPSIE
ncbi:MAG: agmatine deiminase family protein [Methanotrichaceae archaeon]